MFFVPLDYLMQYPEEVYRYKVSAQVDDFPYERLGFFPGPIPGARASWMSPSTSTRATSSGA